MTKSLLFNLLGAVLLALTIDGVLSCTSKSGNSNGGAVTTSTPCGVCGDPITVTLVFNNILKEPFFNFNLTVPDEPQRELVFFLQSAANKEKKARFTSSYWGSLGYMIESVNKVAASVAEKTYWQILDKTTGVALNLGVSSYIPEHQEILLFNFTTYGNH